MRYLVLALAVWLGTFVSARAQTVQDILQVHADEIAKPSRRSVSVALDDLVASGLPQVPVFLEQWSARNVWQRDDGQFFIGDADGDDLALTDIDTGAASFALKSEFTQIRPNGGVRRVIGTALVQFQLSDPDLGRRETAVASIARRPEAAQLAPLLASIEGEPDAALKARKVQLANFLSARFADDPADRIAAINSLSSDTSVEARSVLNQILTTEPGVSASEPEGNIARVLDPMIDPDGFYAQLVEAELAPTRTPPDVIRAALEANVVEGRVGDVPVAQLGTDQMREAAYAQLADAGLVASLVTVSDRDAAIAAHVFFEAYDEADPTITAAAEAALASVEQRVAFAQAADLALDGLSLASIYFLAAIGLAITFGVMGVINMAHGEFIMMGAYTG
ncbi:ABC transporter permease subunit [Tateyamaria sp.]|uniref:ABC transporter permease subunit n=1 Tax=Tateyamaria sp. TaxID=1929288 RepID=UPI003B20EFB4